MLYADFEVSINTSELEEALNGSLSKLGYKVISVKDRYLYKEYRDNNFVPVKKFNFRPPSLMLRGRF